MGYKYIVTKLKSESNTFFRVYAVIDYTSIENTYRNETITMQLDRGQYFESKLQSGAFSLISSDRILVTQYNSGRYSFMSNVQVISQFANTYDFFVQDTDEFDTYVTITISRYYEKKLVFNEQYIPIWTETSDADIGGTRYLIATMKVRVSGYHRISTTNNVGRFGGFVHGYRRGYEVYAYPLGMLLSTC